MDAYHQSPSTLFAADSLASLGPLPGSAKAREMTATSGRKCAVSLGNSSQDTSLQKMFRGLMTSNSWGSTAVYLTWKVSVTKQGRLKYRLVPWAPRTDEADCGLWATPNVPNGGRSIKHATIKGRTAYHNGGKVQIVLEAQVKLWPTHTVSSGAQVAEDPTPGQTGGTTLEGAVRASLMPTPTSRDQKDGSAQSCKNVPVNGLLGRAVHSYPNSSPSGSLNPTWVEGLMGYPHGWTEVD